MSDQKRKGLFIETEILKNKSIPAEYKIILSQIIYSSNEGECYASNTHIAKIIGMSSSTVKRKIKFLHDLGIISCHVESGVRRVMSIKDMSKENLNKLKTENYNGTQKSRPKSKSRSNAEKQPKLNGTISDPWNTGLPKLGSE